MKKFFTYILIFVTILQLVTPPSPVQAQTPPQGFCTIKLGGIPQEPKKTTEEDCRAEAESSGGLKTWSWYKDTSTTGGGTTTTPVSTESPTDKGDCTIPGATLTNVTREFCKNNGGTFKAFGATTTTGGTTTNPEVNATGSATAAPDAPKDPNADIFGSCSGWNLVVAWNVTGCVVRAFHLIFMVLPSMVLYITAYIFNAMLALTLGTVLYKNSFLPEAWRIVRDFSNIFFILVLLYISIKMILGLGGAEIKKMIAQVIVAALLINFSMFMTQVIIDASNMLALIFYNKIGVTSQTYTPFISTKNGVQDKDIAGAIVSGFNPAKFINPADVAEINNKAVASGGLFNDLKNIAKDPNTTLSILRPIDSTTTKLQIGWAVAKSALTSGGDEKTFPPSIALAIIFTACGVYLFASYAFFIAGLAFIGRLIELWMLIIFSPFAFMSLSVPKLKSVDYLGWDAWLKRLMNVAFMAPIFMFFLLLISKLVQINIFKGMENVSGGTLITIPHVLVMLIIPAIIYITLLYKAIDFARKGAGELGSKVISFGEGAAKAIGVGALTIGAAVATDGASLALTSGLGKASSAISSNKNIIEGSQQKGFKGMFNKGLLNLADYGKEAPINLRKAPGIGRLFKATGTSQSQAGIYKALGLNTEHGYEGIEKQAEERRAKREKQLKYREDSPEMHKLHQVQEDKQKLDQMASYSIEQITSDEDVWKTKKKNAVNNSDEDKAAAAKLKELDDIKTGITLGIIPLLKKDEFGNYKDKDGNWNAINEKGEFLKNGQEAIYATDNKKIAESGVAKKERDLAEEETSLKTSEASFSEAKKREEEATKAKIEAEEEATRAIEARTKAEDKFKNNPNSSEAKEELAKLDKLIEETQKKKDETKTSAESIQKEFKVVADTHGERVNKIETMRKETERLRGIATEKGTGAHSIKDYKIEIPKIENDMRREENRRILKEADNISAKRFSLFRNIDNHIAHKMRMGAEITKDSGSHK